MGYVIVPRQRIAQLTCTQQGAFLDGDDDACSREQATNWLLDKLAASLE